MNCWTMKEMMQRSNGKSRGTVWFGQPSHQGQLKTLDETSGGGGCCELESQLGGRELRTASSGLCLVLVGGEKCRALETASEVGAGGSEDTGLTELRERPREEGSWRRPDHQVL